jgi:hypothetical protein
MSDTIKRSHSPDYPAISLKEALERCGKLYKQVQSHPVGRELAARGLGYNTLNGASASAIAAIRKYGLMLKQGDTLRLSERTKTILFPHSEKEKATALRDAALTPPLFQDLYNTFKGMPGNEELIRSYLVRKGFLLNAATLAVNSFRDTMTIVSDTEEEYSDPAEGQGEDEQMQSGVEIDSKPVTLVAKNPAPTEAHWMSLAKQYAQHGERRLFNYDFEEDGGVGVVIRGVVDTTEALDIIDAWIKIKRRELARKAANGEVSSQVRSASDVEDDQSAPQN